MFRTTTVAMMLALTFVLAACGSEGGEMEILTMEPKVGAMQTETPVKIGGQNFRTDIGYTVYFGHRKANQVTILDPQTLLVIAPTSPDPGTVDVSVRADDGGAFLIHDAWRYEDMGGNVVERMGESQMQEGGGNLAY